MYSCKLWIYKKLTQGEGSEKGTFVSEAAACDFKPDLELGSVEGEEYTRKALPGDCSILEARGEAARWGSKRKKEKGANI